MFAAQSPALSEPEFQLLSGAAESHSSSVIALVASRLSSSSNMTQSQIETLSRLWREQLQELRAPPKMLQSVSLDGVFDGPVIPAHPRLLEHVRTLQPIFGCVGRPAPYLKPPEYPWQQKKSDRKLKVEEDVGTSKKMKRSTKASRSTQSSQSAASTSTQEASDLVLGMMVHADLCAFLQITPKNTEEIQWVTGRVVSIVKPPNPFRTTSSFRANTVKIRFPNGGEIETFWPRNPLLQVLDAPTTNNAGGIEGNAAQSGAGADGSTGSGNGGGADTVENIFASLLGDDSSDDDDELDAELRALQSSGGDALRILLGGDDYDMPAADLAPLSAPPPILGRSLAIDAQLHSVHSERGIATNNDSNNMNKDAVTTDDTPTIEMKAPQHQHHTQGVHKEVALLATGEKVPAFSLEEIERKFEHYRPRFKITPDQGDADLQIHASMRRDRSFASRQWTSTSSTSNTVNMYGEETALEGPLLDVTLSAAEDPALPLPEPDAVFIGKVSKQVRRWEGQWRAQLFDVAVRDLRRDTTPTTTTTSTSDTPAGVGQGADLILPRCSVTLDPTILFPLEHVVPGVSDSAGGGDGRGDGSDPVARENLALLLALCT